MILEIKIVVSLGSGGSDWEGTSGGLLWGWQWSRSCSGVLVTWVSSFYGNSDFTCDLCTFLSACSTSIKGFWKRSINYLIFWPLTFVTANWILMSLLFLLELLIGKCSTLILKFFSNFSFLLCPICISPVATGGNSQHGFRKKSSAISCCALGASCLLHVTLRISICKRGEVRQCVQMPADHLA